MKEQPTFRKVFSFYNLIQSAEKCCKGVSWKKSVQLFKMNLLMWCFTLQYQVLNHIYKTKGFSEFYINERGKTRFIQAVHITERVVQKTLCEYGLKPILLPSLIYDNGASIQGKGTDFSIKRFREHLRWHYARYGLKGGILICDFKDYFHSISHAILINMLEKKIQDKDILSLTKYFINQFKDGGLGLGSEISQVCAIFYPNEMDHTIKEKYRIHGYGRYMDDFYVISEDINKLKEVLDYIRTISDKLALRLNLKHTCIYKFSHKPTFEFLKCRTTLLENGKILMRPVRKSFKTKRNLIKKQKKMLYDGIIDFDYIIQSMISWQSYALRRKSSYKSVQSMWYYFNNIFAEVIMIEKENNNLLKELKTEVEILRAMFIQMDKKVNTLYKNDYYKQKEKKRQLTEKEKNKI